MPTDPKLASEIEAYHDGLMTQDQRERFERELQQNAELARAVMAGRRIDQSLSRLFAVPGDSPVSLESLDLGRRIEQHLREHSTHAQQTTARRGTLHAWTRRVAIAALFTVTGYTAWQAWLSLRPAPAAHAVAYTPAQYYDYKKHDFNPYWVCENDEEFAATFRDRLQQALVFKPLPENVKANGMDYVHCMSESTIALLMRAEGREVIVFVDKTAHERNWKNRSDQLQLADGTSLHVFRAQIGDLVAYEITPLASPMVLEHLYDPDVTSNTRG